jgi:hypothetical protein
MYLAAIGAMFFFGLILTVVGFGISKGQRELTLALAAPGVVALLATTVRIGIGMRTRSEVHAFRFAGVLEIGVGLLWLAFMIVSQRASSSLAPLYATCSAAFVASGLGSVVASFFAVGRKAQNTLRLVTGISCLAVGTATAFAVTLGVGAWLFAHPS